MSGLKLKASGGPRGASGGPRGGLGSAETRVPRRNNVFVCVSFQRHIRNILQALVFHRGSRASERCDFPPRQRRLSHPVSPHRGRPHLRSRKRRAEGGTDRGTDGRSLVQVFVQIQGTHFLSAHLFSAKRQMEASTAQERRVPWKQTISARCPWPASGRPSRRSLKARPIFGE